MVYKLIAFLLFCLYIGLFFFLFILSFTLPPLMRILFIAFLFFLISVPSHMTLFDVKRVNRHWVLSKKKNGYELHHQPPTLPYYLDKKMFLTLLNDAIDKVEREADLKKEGGELLYVTATTGNIAKQLGFTPKEKAKRLITYFSAFWLTFWNVYNVLRLPLLFYKIFKADSFVYVKAMDKTVNHG